MINLKRGRWFGVPWCVVIEDDGHECCLAFGFTTTHAERRCIRHHNAVTRIMFGGYPG